MRIDWFTRWGLGIILIGAMSCPVFAAPPVAAPTVVAPPVPAPDPDAVAAAIKKGVAYLEGIEVKGSWDDAPETFDNQQLHCGGYSALVTYALLAAGEKSSDPHITEAVEHLKQIGPQMNGIYALGMRCQVWASLPKDDALHPFIAADGDALMNATRANSVPGLWQYTTADRAWNLSASQYGVLGLWGYASCGYEVPTEIWKDIELAWTSRQYTDGSWGYIPTARKNPGGIDTRILGSSAMTAAGIASLFVTQDYLHGDDGVTCTGNVNNPAIDNGIAWLARHAGDLGLYPAYTYYAYARIGIAGGYKYFGPYDWYAHGVWELLQHQNHDGSFQIGGATSLGRVSDTSLALLFLSRGRAPVILNKLRYGINVKGISAPETRWNQRPRDAANVTRWISKELETDFNWQLVTLDIPVEELHDAPILYISGNQAVTLGAEQEDKLRTFVEEGGLILANADCGNKEFVEGIKNLGRRLFPDYGFARLPADASLFKTPYPLKSPGEVWEQSNGIRPLVMILADDPGRSWQTLATTTRMGDFKLLENILLSVQDARHLMYKGQTYVVLPDPAVHPPKQIRVARLQYSGNWNPEPGGWRRLAAIFHNTRKTDLQIDSIKLGDGKLDNSYDVADLTGTLVFMLADPERAELKRYIDGGGTVIFDAAGGESAFAGSSIAAIAALYPKADPQLLPSAHAVLQVDGKPIEADYRAAARMLIHGNSARLQGVQINGRTAIFFSGEDLASALVGQPLAAVNGYDPTTAVALVGNILEYAASEKSPAAPAQP